jgi:hypothetical protein
MLGIQTDISEIARYKEVEKENEKLKAELKKKNLKSV